MSFHLDNEDNSRMGSVRKLTIDSSVYILSGTAITAATGFLLIPMLIRFLPPVDYGVISIVTVTASGWCLLLNLGMNGAISQSFHGFHDGSESAKEFIGSVFFFILSFWLVLLFLFSAVEFSSIFNFSSREWFFMMMSLLLGGSESLFSVISTVLKIQSKAKQFAIVSIFRSFSLISLIAILAFNDRLIDETKIIADLIAAFLALSLSILLVINSLSFTINKKHLYYALSFGIPSLPHHISTLFLMSGDRYVLKLILGTSSVGIYTLGYQLSIGMYILTMGFDNAWNPHFFKNAHRGKNATANLRPLVKTYSSGISLLAMIYVGFISLVGRFFISEEYSGAYDIIPIVTMGLAFQGFYFLSVKPILFEKKTALLSAVTSIAAIFNLVLNFALIPHVGMLGAAVATYLSYLFQCIVTAIISSKYTEMFSSKWIPIRDFSLMTLGILSLDFFSDSILIFLLCSLILVSFTISSASEIVRSNSHHSD